MNILFVTWIAMLSLFIVTTASAADIEVVVDKSALGPGIFAADEIHREATARDAASQSSAFKYLENALTHWKQYAAIYDRQYTPQLLNPVGTADIPALTNKAAEDIEIVRNWKPGTAPVLK